MEVESYFLRYAMPCAFIIRDMGEIDDEELKKLEDFAARDEPYSRRRLENIFFRAFEKIDRHAAAVGGARWDRDVIESYFKEAHNAEIDKHEGYYATCSEMQRELSKVRVGEIQEVHDNGFYKVELENGTERLVSSKLVPGLAVGDRVYTHFFFATEIAE